MVFLTSRSHSPSLSLNLTRLLSRMPLSYTHGAHSPHTQGAKREVRELQCLPMAMDDAFFRDRSLPPPLSISALAFLRA
jgi:hypothetical protein